MFYTQHGHLMNKQKRMNEHMNNNQKQRHHYLNKISRNSKNNHEQMLRCISLCWFVYCFCGRQTLWWACLHSPQTLHTYAKHVPAAYPKTSQTYPTELHVHCKTFASKNTSFWNFLGSWRIWGAPAGLQNSFPSILVPVRLYGAKIWPRNLLGGISFPERAQLSPLEHQEGVLALLLIF